MTWRGGPRPALDERQQAHVVELMEWRERRRAAGAVVLMDDLAASYGVCKRTLYRYVARRRHETSDTK